VYSVISVPLLNGVPRDVKFKKRSMRAGVPIPAVADASVSHSAAVGGSVVGVVGLL